MKASSAFELYIYIYLKDSTPHKKSTKFSSVFFLHWIERNFTNVRVRLSEYVESSIKFASGNSFS